jgi:hypothetical protein
MVQQGDIIPLEKCGFFTSKEEKVTFEHRKSGKTEKTVQEFLL